MKHPRYVTRLKDIPQLTNEELHNLQPVVERYAFRANEYYLSLIDWDDPNDPIRRIVIPHKSELLEWGELDPSNEEYYTVAPGTQHKYRDTAVLLVNDVCGAYCRFCFRKRLFLNENDEVVRDISEGLDYIRKHKEINNVLLSGGDPLLMSTGKLERIIRQVRDIDHIHIIRIGTKMLSFNPYRVLADASLPGMLSRYSTTHRRIYIMAHFNHPHELTSEAIAAVDILQQAGLITVNQTPFIRGVNDDSLLLSDLFNKLSYIGVPPYYLFQCRPTAGNHTYAVPIEEGIRILRAARMGCSGLAKRARYTMSHHTGKLEIFGMSDSQVFFKYHRAAEKRMIGKILALGRNPDAYWLDDYEEVSSGIRAEDVLDEISLN